MRRRKFGNTHKQMPWLGNWHLYRPLKYSTLLTVYIFAKILPKTWNILVYLMRLSIVALQQLTIGDLSVYILVLRTPPPSPTLSAYFLPVPYLSECAASLSATPSARLPESARNVPTSLRAGRQVAPGCAGRTRPFEVPLCALPLPIRRVRLLLPGNHRISLICL